MIEYENLQKVNKEFESEFLKSFQEFLSSGRYVLGEKVIEFEAKFASFVGTKNCVGVSNGLDALRLAIEAYSFDSNSEIIVPSNTYIATILAILQAGLKPVLVEPDIETYNIGDFEKAITSKTVAVMPVHLYGRPCDMKAIRAMGQDLKIIEDCAQAHGAGVGLAVGCYSFYPTKNLGCLGDAGAITLDDDDLATRLKSLRNYGRVAKYENAIVGWNNRMDEIQAAFLLIKLARLNEIVLHKRKLARIYDENLKHVIKPKPHPEHVYHIYNIRCSSRDDLKRYLSERGVETEIHYPIAPHKQKALMFLGGDFPISDEIHATTLSLPISYCHTTEQIYRVVDIVNSFFD